MVAGRMSRLWWAIAIAGFALVFGVVGLVLGVLAPPEGGTRATGIVFLGIAAVAAFVGVTIWRASAKRRAHQERLAATGARAEGVVVGVAQGGGTISTNGRVTQTRVHLTLDVGEEEPVRVPGAWLPPRIAPGHLARVAYDRGTREAVLLEVPRAADEEPAAPPRAIRDAPSPTPAPAPAPARRTADESLSPDAVAERIGLGGD